MNRRNRHLVVILIAVVTASIASFGVYRVMVGMPRAGQTQLPVVVAARSMAIGTQLTDRDLKVISWPATSLVPGAINSIKEAVNRGLLTGVLQNEPITSDKLAPSQAGAGLPPAIPQGMRAMSVKVNDVIGVAGFVVPGSRVDVVVTIRRGEDGATTSTVATNVQVMAAGTRQDQEKPDPGAKAKDTTVVTLMVTPKDAERIALAQSEGQIVLSLRNPLDTEPTVTDGVRTGALLGQATTPPPAPAVVKAPAPRRVVAAAPPPPVEPPAPTPRKVEAFRAGKRAEEVVREPGKETSKEPGKEVVTEPGKEVVRQAGKDGVK
jgi:pilus assembly protein CpaB